MATHTVVSCYTDSSQTSFPISISRLHPPNPRWQPSSRRTTSMLASWFSCLLTKYYRVFTAWAGGWRRMFHKWHSETSQKVQARSREVLMSPEITLNIGWIYWMDIVKEGGEAGGSDGSPSFWLLVVVLVFLSPNATSWCSTTACIDG